MERFVNKLHISKSYETIGPKLPESPMHASDQRTRFMSPKPIGPLEIPMDVENKDVKLVLKPKKTVEAEYFKWCNCHIYLSYGGVYPDTCFKDCNLHTSNAHIMETRDEYINRMIEMRKKRKY